MEKKVIKRINELLKIKHLTTNQLARTLGISPSSVYGYLSGESKPPMYFIVLFLESFPDVSAEWLLRGEGEMMKLKRQSHYLEMAARVNGTYMASEETDPQKLYNDTVSLISELRSDIEKTQIENERRFAHILQTLNNKNA
jgi:transcriptional regulator with XRE-family HTH domain